MICKFSQDAVFDSFVDLHVSAMRITCIAESPEDLKASRKRYSLRGKDPTNVL